MSTLGQKPATQHVSTEKQTITGNGGPSYTLQQSVSQASDIEVFVNNTRQEPTVAYTASGTTLTMTGAVNSSDSFYVIFQGKAIQTAGLPVDAAITASTISASQTLAVTGATTLSSNATVGGTLGVTGAATLSGNAAIGGTLAVTGVHTIGTNAVITSEGGATTTNLSQVAFKVYVNYAENASISDSVNVSSIIDGGTGVHTVVINNDMSNTNYTTIGSAAGYHEHCIFAGRSTGSFPSYGRNNESNSGNYDINGMIGVLGDLA